MVSGRPAGTVTPVSLTPGNLPNAGWYPDPSGRDALRWWDGQAWTERVETNGAATASVPGSSAPAPSDSASAPTGASAGGPGPTPSSEPTFPARAAWYGVVGVVGGFVIAGFLQGFGLLVFPGSDAAGILLGSIGLWTGFGGTCLVVSRRFGTGSIIEDFALRWRPVDIAFGAVAALVGLFTAGLISLAFQGTRLYGKNTDILTEQRSTLGVTIVAVIAAVGAPLFEELFFRGFLRRALSSRLGVGAVWAQAILFGFAHYQFGQGLRNVSVVCVTAGLGVVFGYTAHLTRRLGAGIIAHGLFNLYVTLTIIGVVQVRL